MYMYGYTMFMCMYVYVCMHIVYMYVCLYACMYVCVCMVYIYWRIMGDFHSTYTKLYYLCACVIT